MTSPTPTTPGTDRRILRTRKLLWDAFIALIQEKDYSEITIQDIADRANVNRVTFYLHYRDKHELLLKNVEVIFDELTSKIAPLNGENYRTDIPPEGMTLVYQYIAENAKFYRIVLGEKGIPFLVNRLRKYLTDLTIQRFQGFQMVIGEENRARISMEIVGQYVAGSIIGLITWWLENDMPISPEDFAHQTLQLTAYGPYWGAGITPPKIDA
ncbi:MAG: TetR/AcrR family transcriptional regulator [Chloroflexota bacterium]